MSQKVKLISKLKTVPKDFTYDEDNFRIGSYIEASDGLFHKENSRDCDFSYCENNIIIDRKSNNKVIKLAHNQLIVGQYVLDLEKKTFLPFNEDSTDDCFISTILTSPTDKIRNIEITKDEQKNKVITLTTDGEYKITIVTNQVNQIIKYINNNVTQVGYEFMNDVGENLEYLEMNNLVSCEDNFLSTNKKLKSLKARANILTVLLLVLFAGIVGTMVATFFVAEQVKFWLVVAALSCCGLFAVLKLAKKIIGDEEGIDCRPADLLEPEFDKFKSEGIEKGRACGWQGGLERDRAIACGYPAACEETWVSLPGLRAAP